MHNGENLLLIAASDRYRFSCKLLDKLFTKAEQAKGTVEATGAGAYPSLDSERIKILKGKKVDKLIKCFNENAFLSF